MLEDAPEKDLYLLNIDRAAFDMLMWIQDKTGDVLRSELNKLSDKQVYHLMNAANYLNTREVLDATALMVASNVFSDATIKQLITKNGYDAYYKNLGLIPDLQIKIAQQFTKLSIFLLFKVWTIDPTVKYLATGSGKETRIFDVESRKELIKHKDLEKILQSLTLNQAQVVALVVTGQVQLGALPNHLQQIYAGLPEVVRLLLEREISLGL